jgi:hypothetical protein
MIFANQHVGSAGQKRNRLILRGFLLALAVALCQFVALADPVPVRYTEGNLHGFLALRNGDGRLLAVGDWTQVVHGSEVTARLLLRFKDGSVDDETTVFSQRKVFRLISDHHVQKGPYFPHPTDLSIDGRTGQVTVRYPGKDGKEEVVSEHMDLPPDLVNGITSILPKNLPADVATTVSMVATTPKPRLVKLVFSPGDEEPFSVGGVPYKALRFAIKVQLGGVAGVVAPLVGKQPADHQVWILRGPAPIVVKEEGFLYEGGPSETMVLTSPEWPRESKPEEAK